MKKTNALLLIIPAVLCMTIYSCANNKSNKNSLSVERLSDFEKHLLTRLIDSMISEKNRLSKVPFEKYDSKASLFVDQVENLLAFPFDPISDEYAKMLRDTFLLKKEKIESFFPMRINSNTGKAEDTKSVWVSVYDFAPFFFQLFDRQIKTDTMLGVRIVFGSYPYDASGDNERDAHDSNIRVNSDRLCGRSTVYLVGTIDSVDNIKDKNAMHQKDLKNLTWPYIKDETNNKSFGPPYSGFNHGTLCPDSCSLNP